MAIIDEVVERWHRHLRGELPGGLDELLADDVVFYSPVVFTPQEGKAITTAYLQAAGVALVAGRPDEPAAAQGEASGAGREPRFRYTKQVTTGDTAVLEFETTVRGKYVNGVDIMRCDDAGRIVELRVMLRPLQAVNVVHELMRELLESMGRAG